ncbi:cytochrome P450 [Tistrella mobilis]
MTVIGRGEAALNGGRAESIDFGSAGFRTDPWPAYAAARRDHPVWWSQRLGQICVVRHADVMRVLTDPVFTVEYPFKRTRQAFGETLLDIDGARHLAQRRAAQHLLGFEGVAAAVAGLAPGIIGTTISGLPAGRPVDAVAALAEPIAQGVIRGLFGIDAETGDRLARHLSRVSRYIETADVDLGDVVEDRRALEAEIGRLIDDGLSPRPAALALRVQRMASELERTQLMRLMLLMMAAGVETPLSAIANALAMLLDRRHLIDRLAVEPSLADSFALEVMRFQPPQHDTTRFVRGHTMLGGIEVRRGTSVRVFLASANRDESVFHAADRFDPERFLPGRPPVPVLSFGAGRHACPGRPLASAIIAEALRRLASGFQDIRPAEDCDPIITGEGFRRPRRLTLVLDPRRRPATASLPGAAVA